MDGRDRRRACAAGAGGARDRPQARVPDAGNDPTSTTTRRAYELVTAKFGPGANGPLVRVARGGDRDAVERLAGTLRREPGIASVAPPAVSPARETAVIVATPTGSPQAATTEALIERLRDGRLDRERLRVDLGGATAQQVAQSATTSARLPLFMGGVVGLSLLADGGWAGQLIGIETATPVPPFIPSLWSPSSSAPRWTTRSS